jgi:hypothetical protein
MIEKSKIPAGKSGKWEVRKFEVAKQDAAIFNISALFGGFGERAVDPGKYTKLVRIDDPEKDHGILMMSDTPAELRDNAEFYHRAQGNVLINGLGLGVVARAVLLKDIVFKVTINEIEQDIINLVAPHLISEFGDKVVINHVSAFDYHPGKERFNTIFHDIWADITLDNLEEYKKLMRRYGHWLMNPKWHDCWAYDYLKRFQREERRSPWRW